MNPNLLAILMGTGGLQTRRGLSGQTLGTQGRSMSGLDPNLAAILMGTGGMQVRRGLSGQIMMPGEGGGGSLPMQFNLPARTQVSAPRPAPAPQQQVPAMNAQPTRGPVGQSTGPMLKMFSGPLRPKAVPTAMSMARPSEQPAFDLSKLAPPNVDPIAAFANDMQNASGPYKVGAQKSDPAADPYFAQSAALTADRDAQAAQDDVSRTHQIQSMIKALMGMEQEGLQRANDPGNLGAMQLQQYQNDSEPSFLFKDLWTGPPVSIDQMRELQGLQNAQVGRAQQQRLALMRLLGL